MNIKTKYETGQHIWCAYENKGEVQVFDDYIGWITFEDNELRYGLKETYEDLKEEEVILYEETDKLVERIKQVMQEIRKKENNGG